MANITDENLIFIREIKDRPEIWDQYSKNYHNREVTEKSWNELSQKYTASVEHLKTKWVGLRSRFRKSYLNQIAFRKKNPDKIIRVWKYFIPLLFLKDQMKKNKSKDIEASVAESEEEVVDKVNKEFEEMEADYEELHETEYISLEQIQKIEGCFSEEITSDSTWRHLINTFQKDIQAMEVQRAATIDKSKTDEDLLFLHSLLPYLKSLDFKRKLVLRTEIQKAVCEFITNLNDSYFDSVTTIKNKKTEHVLEENSFQVSDNDMQSQHDVSSNVIEICNEEVIDRGQNVNQTNSENMHLEKGMSSGSNKDNVYIWLLNGE